MSSGAGSCYVERIGELLADGYLVPVHGSDIRLTPAGVRRLHELIHDGLLYTAKREDNVQLTYKGLRVLLACADRPVKPRRVIKRIPVQRRGE
jgi:hypothetical protein